MDGGTFAEAARPRGCLGEIRDGAGIWDLKGDLDTRLLLNTCLKLLLERRATAVRRGWAWSELGDANPPSRFAMRKGVVPFDQPPVDSLRMLSFMVSCRILPGVEEEDGGIVNDCAAGGSVEGKAWES